MFYAFVRRADLQGAQVCLLKEIVPCIDIVMESELRTPWWEQLPDDFWQQVDGTELDARNRLKVHGTAAIERVLRTSLSTTVAAAMAAALSKGGDMEREFEALRFYEPLARAGDASRVSPAAAEGYCHRVTARERGLSEVSSNQTLPAALRQPVPTAESGRAVAIRQHAA